MHNQRKFGNFFFGGWVGGLIAASKQQKEE